MGDVQLADSPRVVIARESVWLVQLPGHAAQRDPHLERRGFLALSHYAVYPGTRDARAIGAVVEPVLRALASSRARAVLVLTESSLSFDAGRIRAAVRLARDIGIASMVEISGEWTPTLLELLVAPGPSYVRLAPQMLRGAAVIPDTCRSLVLLGEFARTHAVELIARNPYDAVELHAIRAAGIELAQWTSLPDEARVPSAAMDLALRGV
ncbi:MAG: hypothetical protein IT360_04300 [Gemmatimonadaceae bacterium]|nr:hypothetical protein [Gemmatimonadaceae bacterium]